LHFLHHGSVQIRNPRVELIEQLEQLVPATVGPPIQHQGFQLHAPHLAPQLLFAAQALTDG
jgi:hypothetical protein